jgi:2,3-bisphosphoglycerate-independent phosphoglycerate mutase
MKYMLILADGMADYKIKELGGQTPLQYAHTPNMDYLAKTSRIGMVRTVPPNFPPGSDVANLSVMGYNPEKYYSGRSPLEAVSMGVDLGADDLAFRCNLVTLSPETEYRTKTMLDYSAGEISSKEAGELIASLKMHLDSKTRRFHAGISYRHLMVWQGAINKNFILTPPHDISNKKIADYLPAGKDGQVLLNMMMQSEAVLSNHPVNEARRNKGQNPATSIWFWGEGSKPALDSFAQKYQLKGSVVCAVDLVRGLGICAGLTPVQVAGATGGIKTNFAGKARAALDELKRGQDFVYVHIESPDEAGHQGEIATKVWSIEKIDREVLGLVISELNDFDDIKIMLLPDHPTPIEVRTHTSEPVPFLLFDKNRPVSSVGIYNEEAAARGQFIKNGYELMDEFIKG